MDLEQRTYDQELHKDNVFRIGLEILKRHRSYERVTIRDSSASREEDLQYQLHTLERQVIQFFNSKDMIILKEDIAPCHTFKKKKKM